MFLFIGGIQPKTVMVDHQPRSCPECGQLRLYKKRVDSYFALFFIPLFRLRKGLEFFECSHCSRVLEGNFYNQKQSNSGRKRCPSCFAFMEENYPYCPYCGKKL